MIVPVFLSMAKRFASLPDVMSYVRIDDGLLARSLSVAWITAKVVPRGASSFMETW